jgi:hypothetical protein
MKPDIELCSELLKALLKDRDLHGLAKARLEALSSLLRGFRLEDAYEREAARHRQGVVNLRGSFKSLVDEAGVHGRLAELDALVPMAAMVMGFGEMDEPPLRARDLKTLETRVSQLDTALQGLGETGSKIETLSQRVTELDAGPKLEALSKRVAELEAKAALLSPDLRGRRRWMTAIAVLAFVLTLVMIGYGFVWGYLHGDPEISIELDIGQLIGGTLLGTGAILAGGAYALATLRRLKDGA